VLAIVTIARPWKRRFWSEGGKVATRAFGCQIGIRCYQTRPNATRANVVAMGQTRPSGSRHQISQPVFSLCFTQIVPMSPNSAPFVVRHITVVYIATWNPQHPVANVIVDGSSPFTRSLTTADSNCQPLFILRMGRELGRF
jgi:hypothetical protein